MSRCVGCQHAVYDQFQGYPGRWMCFHPYRRELSNKGTFTYPGNDSPYIVICETLATGCGDLCQQKAALAEAKTPVWCYFEAVERAKREQPGFDPDIQRAILWPSKVKDRERVIEKTEGNVL